LHAAIANLKFVNRGIGPLLLPRVVANLFELEPRCRRIMFDPRSTQQRCQAAVRVRRFLGEHDMSNGRMALYALRRESK